MRRLLRVLFPSWRFFDSLSVVPVLSYRLRGANHPGDAWHAVLSSHRRTAGEWFWNPTGNWLLACHGAVERLVDDVNELPVDGLATLRESVSYRVVEGLVRQASCDPLAEFQFKISSGTHDILVSEWHAGNPP